jgi:hypothetical protein
VLQAASPYTVPRELLMVTLLPGALVTATCWQPPMAPRAGLPRLSSTFTAKVEALMAMPAEAIRPST